MNSNGRMGLKLYPGEVVENQINFMDVSMLKHDEEDEEEEEHEGEEKHMPCTNEGQGA